MDGMREHNKGISSVEKREKYSERESERVRDSGGALSISATVACSLQPAVAFVIKI